MAEDKDLEWWHWIPGFWLVTTRSGDVSTEETRNQLRKRTDGKDIMVLEIGRPTTWSGYGPDTRERACSNGFAERGRRIDGSNRNDFVEVAEAGVAVARRDLEIVINAVGSEEGFRLQRSVRSRGRSAGS